jgi:hypothetical protein
VFRLNHLVSLAAVLGYDLISRGDVQNSTLEYLVHNA